VPQGSIQFNVVDLTDEGYWPLIENFAFSTRITKRTNFPLKLSLFTDPIVINLQPAVLLTLIEMSKYLTQISKEKCKFLCFKFLFFFFMIYFLCFDCFVCFYVLYCCAFLFVFCLCFVLFCFILFF
jgi:hypothetical protein